MKQTWMGILLFCLMVPLWDLVWAGSSPKGEAKALVEKAAQFIRTSGRERAFAEFNRRQGRFSKRELYIFAIDLEGNMLAHGGNPALQGKNLIDLQDTDGRLLTQDMIESVKHGSGWLRYKWLNPVTGKVQSKESYLIEVDREFVLGCGVYE